MDAAPFITIAGSGLLTPLGLDVAQNWSALLAGRFISTHARCDIPDDRFRAGVLANHVANQALACAGWTQADLHSDRTALIVGTSKGPIEDFLAPPSTSHKPLSRISAAPGAECSPVPIDFGLAEIASHLHKTLGLTHGPMLTLSAACASGLHALIRAAMMLRSGEIDRALVVATESSLHKLFISSFSRLGVLSKPGIGCRPFDVHRDGFLLSECAAAICLEAQSESAGRTCIDRFAMAGDPTSITGADPQGRTLRYLLAKTLGNAAVDLIHAHGTGTPLNDPIELAAIDDTIPLENSPHLYSHKGALGHSLGAAGLVAVVLSDQMHQRGVILPNVQTRQPLPTHRLNLASTPVTRRIRTSIAIATGFGGPSAVVRLISP